MNLQDEIKALKDRIVELEELVKEEMEFPQNGDKYWYMDDEGELLCTFYDNHYIDISHQEIGNIFQTKDEAEFAVEKLKVEEELRKFSRPFEYGKFNYYLFFNIESDSLDTQFTSYCPPQGAIYFESEEKAQKAVSAVGKERIEKYLFGLED